MRNVTFSRKYPSYHPKKGQPTFFVEKIWKSMGGIDHFSEIGYYQFSKYLGYNPDSNDLINKVNNSDPKYHTIRKGRRWKVGDWFQPVFWGDDINPKSGRSGPYHSKQIGFSPPIQVKYVWDFEIKDTIIHLTGSVVHVDGYSYDHTLNEIAKNDGLSTDDLLHWLKFPNDFDGQIICWSENINY